MQWPCSIPQGFDLYAGAVALVVGTTRQGILSLHHTHVFIGEHFTAANTGHWVNSLSMPCLEVEARLKFESPRSRTHNSPVNLNSTLQNHHVPSLSRFHTQVYTALRRMAIRVDWLETRSSIGDDPTEYHDPHFLLSCSKFQYDFVGVAMSFMIEPLRK